MLPVGLPETSLRDSFRFVKEQGIAAFMALCLLAFLGWAVYVWNNVFAAQVGVLQKQTDLMVSMHEDHLKLNDADSRIVDNQTHIIELLQAMEEQEKASNETRDRQNEILRRMEERTH